MVFSDTSDEKQGLIQECESLIFGDEYGAISNNTNRLATFTRGINNALNRVTSLILEADNRWQFDDTNNTDYPIGVANLVTTAGSEQQDYPLDVSHLRIISVEIKDADGNWHKLQPFDQQDLYNTSLTDFLKTAGMPQWYDKTANSVFLYPKPLASAVTESGGLKVFFERAPSYFTTADTTKAPGFNSIYHELVALIASRNYAISKQLVVKDDLIGRVIEGEKALQDNYSLRNKDEKIHISTKKHNFR